MGVERDIVCASAAFVIEHFVPSSGCTTREYARTPTNAHHRTFVEIREPFARNTMKLLACIGLVAITSLAAANVPVRPSTSVDPDNLVVHEWGTFTSVAGEDGVAIDWEPVDAQRDLPCFVDRFLGGPKNAFVGTVRMETPVIYFYTARELRLDVGVRFRQGVITELFPRAEVTPKTVTSASLRSPDFSSVASWKGVAATPGASEQFPIENHTSHYYAARQTEAVPIEVNGQKEKFLFYRGVGSFDLPLAARVAPDGQVLVNTLRSRTPVGTVMLFENHGGKLAYDFRRNITARTAFLKARPADFRTLTSELEQILISEGLFAREARAMVETWRDSWFEEGTRVFYIVPRETVEDVLPLDISPRPTVVARVFVGRMELMTSATLREVRHAIETGDTQTLAKYGRFLQPAVNRLYDRNTSRPEWTAISRALDPVYQARSKAVPACPAVR
jgi:hypothetical protein